MHTAEHHHNQIEKTKLINLLQEILVDDAVAVFYADLNDQVAMRADIGGFDYNPSYNIAKIYDLYRK
jgi:hypothetical protein